MRKSYLYPEYLKAWRDENRGRLNAAQAKRKRERLQEAPEEERRKRRLERAKQNQRPEFRMRANLRRRVHKALKGVCKSASTLDLLGCLMPELKRHIERLFKPGMTWENYGPVWHIDHVRPCASFNLLDLEHQRACFNWTNLQPLFAVENIKKGDNYVR